MKKINWKLRGQNKTTLLALMGGVVTLVYTALRMFGVATSFTEAQWMELAVLLLDVLVLLGIVTDPTTPGVKDSARALGYEQPGKLNRE